MNQKRLLCWMLMLFSLAFLAENSFAQALVTVKGVVVDKDQKAPMPGVSVSSVDNLKGTVTNADGKFEMQVPLNSWLQFSMIGFKTVKMLVKSEKLNVVMDWDSKALEEVVVVGYGTQKKASLTSAVTSVNAKELTNIPASNLSNILAGRASSVFVRSGTGLPGKSSTVRIRAVSSWNAAPPLYVIDGVVRDQSAFDALDPNQIDNLSILKDAASTAIYGSRASNGVLLGNTKKGQKGKL